jgi:hypothetical protein
MVLDNATYAIEFETEAPGSAIAPEFIGVDRPVLDGDPVLHVTSGSPLRYVRVPGLPLELRVRVRGRDHNVFWVLDAIDRQVAASLIYVCTGILPAEWTAYVRAEGPRPALL